jgi:hypothetical protein
MPDPIGVARIPVELDDASLRAGWASIPTLFIAAPSVERRPSISFTIASTALIDSFTELQ